MSLNVFGVLLDQTWIDGRHAWRRLRATPTFTVLAVLSLSLGVGATTAIYSALASIDLTPITVKDPSRIVFVTAGPSRWSAAVSQNDLDELQRAQTSTTSFAATMPIFRTVADANMSDMALGEAVTGSYFSTLGATAVRGRLLQPTDGLPGGPAIVVIAESFWRRVVQSDSAVVGRVLRIAGRPFEVVGVVDDSFKGLSGRAASPTMFWIPSEQTSPSLPVGEGTADRDRPEVTVFGVFEPGRLDAIAAEVGALAASLDNSSPLRTPRADGTFAPAPRRWSATTGEAINSGQRLVPMTVFVTGLVGLLLVIASTNLANLMVGRGAARAAELSVRRALGASRVRLIRELLTESTILAALGGLAAYCVARVLFSVLVIDVPLSRAMVVRLEPHISLSALAVSVVALLLSLVVFGVAPALQLTNARSVGALGSLTFTKDWRTRRRLIAWQVTISTGLLLVALVCARASIFYTGRDTGVDVERLAVGIINFRAEPWTETRARPVMDAILTAAREQSNVESVALSSGTPFGLQITPIASITTLDRPFSNRRQVPGFREAFLVAATPEIFRTLGVPIVQGRAFEVRDTQATMPVAVISQVTATQLFGNTNPLGKEMLLRNYLLMKDSDTTSRVTIVGIAHDTDTGTVNSSQRKEGTVYLPLAQHYENLLSLVVRTSGDPATLVPRLRNVVRMADPDLAMSEAGPGPLMLASSYILLRLATVLTAILAGLAILFATVGLYGVLLQLTVGRVREMGIRAALGAAPAQLRAMVLREGLRPVVQGVVLGCGLGTVLRVVMRNVYPDVPIVDVVGLAVAPLVFVIAGLTACYLPAHRASRVDPNVALKDL